MLDRPNLANRIEGTHSPQGIVKRSSPCGQKFAGVRVAGDSTKAK
ncbi:hypothetical protein J2S92_004231 [Arthrobacter bambusae]|nr:hypothetical protein [Arthrobacter bambusae]MDQ0237864.1 hypothetical protein [Arthrobacter bambusae]